jgi:hypothetical protein
MTASQPLCVVADRGLQNRARLGDERMALRMIALRAADRQGFPFHGCTALLLSSWYTVCGRLLRNNRMLSAMGRSAQVSERRDFASIEADDAL